MYLFYKNVYLILYSVLLFFAIGKSLYVDRLFEKFPQTSTKAQHVRIRLIEPRVDLDSFIQTLSERLALLREQDLVMLHIDTAAVGLQVEVSFLCNDRV